MSLSIFPGHWYILSRYLQSEPDAFLGVQRNVPEFQDFLVSKIPPFGSGSRAQLVSTHIDATSAHLIVKYLSSKRPFFNSFNHYLRDILGASWATLSSSIVIMFIFISTLD